MLWDALRFGEVYTTGEIEGVACWLPPGIGPMTFVRQLRAGMAWLPFSFGLTGLRRLIAFDQLSVSLHHRYAPEPHWYLLALGVDAGKQGRGIGSFLLHPHLERADQEKLPCYLDTHFERNVRLYEKHGFRVMWEGTIPGHPVPAWSMRRDPVS
jgi:GNAT superfamily N-acetyltransferase